MTEPDWARLGRETQYSYDEWINAARYLGDLPDWQDLWPMVEEVSSKMCYSPLRAAQFVRHSYLTRPPGYADETTP